MTRHQKRLSVPKSWPVERKTATFTAKAGAGPHGESGVPLVVVLRDVLGYVDSAKEATYAVNHGGVEVNGGTVDTINRPIGMFDILAFPDRDEYYRVFPDEGGRLGLTPIDADAADSKLGKVIDKTIVDGGQTQLNLHDGSNLLVEEDTYSGSDSVVVDNEEKAVIAHFVYEEGALVTAVAGQHAGEIGEVTDIQVTPGSASNTVTVDTGDGEFETVEEYVVVIDENFVEDDAYDTDEDQEDDVDAADEDQEDDVDAADEDQEDDEDTADEDGEPVADEDGEADEEDEAADAEDAAEESADDNAGESDDDTQEGDA